MQSDLIKEHFHKDKDIDLMKSNEKNCKLSGRILILTMGLCNGYANVLWIFRSLIVALCNFRSKQEKDNILGLLLPLLSFKNIESSGRILILTMGVYYGYANFLWKFRSSMVALCNFRSKQEKDNNQNFCCLYLLWGFGFLIARIAWNRFNI